MRILISIALLFILVFISCEDIIEVTDISEETVQLISPSDSIAVAQSNVNFAWNEVFEATQYHVQVATPDFENAAQVLVDTLVVVDTSFVSPRFNKILEDSEYEWRVKAQNSAYETEFTIHKFYVNTSGN